MFIFVLNFTCFTKMGCYLIVLVVIHCKFVVNEMHRTFNRKHIFEPRHEKTNVLVSDRSDTSQTVQLQKIASGLKFWIESRGIVISLKLICIFVFAYAKRWFSNDAAQF